MMAAEWAASKVVLMASKLVILTVDRLAVLKAACWVVQMGLMKAA